MRCFKHVIEYKSRHDFKNYYLVAKIPASINISENVTISNVYEYGNTLPEFGEIINKQKTDFVASCKQM